MSFFSFLLNASARRTSHFRHGWCIQSRKVERSFFLLSSGIEGGQKAFKAPLAVPPRPSGYLFRFSSTLFVLFLFHRRHCPRGARSNVMGSRTNGLRHCVGIYWTRPWTKVCHCKLWFVHVPLLRAVNEEITDQLPAFLLYDLGALSFSNFQNILYSNIQTFPFKFVTGSVSNLIVK